MQRKRFFKKIVNHQLSEVGMSTLNEDLSMLSQTFGMYDTPSYQKCEYILKVVNDFEKMIENANQWDNPMSIEEQNFYTNIDRVTKELKNIALRFKDVKIMQVEEH